MVQTTGQSASRVRNSCFIAINNLFIFSQTSVIAELAIPHQVLLFGHLNFRECSLRDVPVVTRQFKFRFGCETVDQIFVAESLLEGAGNCRDCTNDKLVRTGGAMSIAALILMTMLVGSTGVRAAGIPLESNQQSNTSLDQRGEIIGGQIKITITTGGGPNGTAKDTYRVGEPIRLVITLTNTGTEPVYVCESGTYYQDRPRLLRNGQAVPYTSDRQEVMQLAEKDGTCQQEDLPQQVLLRPNEPTVVDWFNLVEGTTSLYHDGWYEQLPAGKYTLTNQRRLNCCDGSLVESNTISFVVLP